ncbi:MAG: hypothetical protein PHV02_16670 [Rhodocyclaceae bacterium]|nr:hypothetical protein [Rhodocyclaceae bacterium]
MRFIDGLSFPLLIIMSVFMIGAPFVPEPHLLEKFRMFSDGTLNRAIDVFDVFWHLLPAILLLIKIKRQYGKTMKPV